MTLRAIGPFNGLLPEPTGMVVGFIRDPANTPYLRYAQLVPAPEIQFMYAKLDPDEPVRLVNLNEYAWAYDDYRPTGKGFTVKAEWVDSTVQRWDFPYTLGEHTVRMWNKAGINTRQLYDKIRGNQARLHRSVRVVNALAATGWGANTGTLNGMLGTTGAYWDLSTGDQHMADSTLDPNFQVIKRTFQRVKRRVNLATNGAVQGDEWICVIPPAVAEAIAVSGEIVEFLKQSQYARDMTNPTLRDWSIPDSYGGMRFVVEDTPRCFISQHDDGTVADVTVPAQKDYILQGDTIYFVARSGGLDGGYGFRNFSTVQIYHYGGEARVEAFSEPKHELVEGHVVMEDRVLVPAVISGFKLTGTLSTAA